MFDSVLKTPMMFVSSVIRRKGKSQNGSNKKIKPNFLKKRNISYPLTQKKIRMRISKRCAYLGVRRSVRFSKKILACFVFLLPSF